MSDDDTRKSAISVFAGEVVLGTGNRDDRSVVEARLASDPLYQTELRAWERRLAPLSAVVKPVDPDAALWARIEAATILRPAPVEAPAPEAREGASVVTLDRDTMLAARNRLLERRLGRWRAATAASLALAASLVGVVVVRPDLLPIPQPTAVAERFVGVVNASGETPPLIVSVDLAKGEISLRPLALQPVDGKALELWALPENAQPVSLGLVSDGRRPFAEAARKAFTKAGLAIAVSVEPVGGSPTGLPTGQVILTGKLVEAE